MIWNDRPVRYSVHLKISTSNVSGSNGSIRIPEVNLIG